MPATGDTSCRKRRTATGGRPVHRLNALCKFGPGEICRRRSGNEIDRHPREERGSGKANPARGNHGVTGATHRVAAKNQCADGAICVRDLTGELAIFQKGRCETRAYCVGRIDRAKSCGAAHINRWTSRNREGAHTKVAQPLMERGQITPRGRAESRATGNSGAACEPRAL